MRMSPQIHAMGCVTSLVSLSSFVSGVYQGLLETKGESIDPTYLSIIRYGPITLNGLLGIPIAAITTNDRETLDSMMQGFPSGAGMHLEQAEGCTKGCMSLAFPILGAGFTAGLQYLGYVIGKSVGNAA